MLIVPRGTFNRNCKLFAIVPRGTILDFYQIKTKKFKKDIIFYWEINIYQMFHVEQIYSFYIVSVLGHIVKFYLKSLF